MQIKASDVEFWKNADVSVMLRKHEKKMYPPRVVITATSNTDSIPAFLLAVKFEGCSGDCHLDRDINFPIGNAISYYSS